MRTREIKCNGIHYTPSDLADFLAAVTVRSLRDGSEKIEVLDPACGDGALLHAFARALPRASRSRCALTGYETDPDAAGRAGDLLREAGVASIHIEVRDFLAGGCARRGQLGLFETRTEAKGRTFDAIIANPPYVRTQVLGSARSQNLAKRFGLSGRVDLYHAFVRAMADALRPGGTMGLLTSNRFLTTVSGVGTRKLLNSEMSPESIYDLGDTKLFSAAVLPAIVVATRQMAGPRAPCCFSRVYEYRGKPNPPQNGCKRSSVLAALREPDLGGIVQTPAGVYEIERGVLLKTGHEEIWSLSTPRYEGFLASVENNRSSSFDEVAKIRVGIKTTADEVFLRDDWSALPPDIQPEPELLRPLIRHYDVTRWRSGQPRQTVLYPHMIRGGKRVPINLAQFPRAKRYLEQHRDRLCGRHYVTGSGREWYEIWVPHSPADWRKPKIVYPDIAKDARFFLDTSGAVVNGDCYWITLRDGRDPELLLLMAAVANSTFATRYYDVAFHNKLYAGRRRFMAQYVKKFPLPRLEGGRTRRIIAIARELTGTKKTDPALEEKLDGLVWEAFGLSKKI